MQVLGQARRRHQILQLIVEAAAMHSPKLAGDALLLQHRIARRLEAVVEPDEVERGADPRDAGHEMQPAHDKVQPLEEVNVHVSGGAVRRANHDGTHRLAVASFRPLLPRGVAR